MLVLGRRKNEEIIIGKGTPYEGRIVVVEISHDKVRLGLEFSKDVEIIRPDANVKEKRQR